MTFDHFIEGVAGEFIQSVIVVDDRITLDAAEGIAPITAINRPKVRGMVDSGDQEMSASARGSAAEEEASGNMPRRDAAPPVDDGDLDGMELTRGFASFGVACSVYKPMTGSTVTRDVENTASIARHADVVVLDWRIGPDSEQSRMILRRIVEEDVAEGGRLRLIAIYTSEPNLDSIADTIRVDLENLEQEVTKAGSQHPMLCWGASAIVVIGKHRPGILSDGVKEADLPSRIVKFFASLSHGITPAVALAAIHSIRRSTHHLLARFHRDLDPGLATHRALLRHPDEAETFIAELVADELKTIIETGRVGPRHADMTVMDLWLSSLAQAGHAFKTEDGKCSLSHEDALRLLKEGERAHGPVAQAQKPAVGKDALQRSITEIFLGSSASAQRVNHELSRLSIFEREAHSKSWLSDTWKPALSLGSVVAIEGMAEKAFVCIQPACDAVRVEPSGRFFVFVPLQHDDKNFALVVRMPDKREIRFRPKVQSYETQRFEFVPDSAAERVLARRDGGKLHFISKDGERFQWLADLRRPIANRLMQQVATQAERIGLDKYEWLRKMDGSKS